MRGEDEFYYHVDISVPSHGLQWHTYVHY